MTDPFHQFQIVFDALATYWLVVIGLYLFLVHKDRKP